MALKHPTAPSSAPMDVFNGSPETGNPETWINPDTTTFYILYKGVWVESRVPRKNVNDGRYEKVHVPFELSHLICRCRKGQRTLRPRLINGKKSRYIECGTCGKYARYLMLRCSGCGEYFLNTFKHPFKCLFEPHCWNCINDLTEPICTHVPGDYHQQCEWLRLYHDYVAEPPQPVDLTRREHSEALPDLSFDLSF